VARLERTCRELDWPSDEVLRAVFAIAGVLAGLAIMLLLQRLR
jgi:ribose/xylose/arabinose/galactoside ABC-type transport system permease subunit